MKSIKMSIKFLICSLLFTNAIGKYISDTYLEQKLLVLEENVRRLGCQKYMAYGYKYEHWYSVDDVAFDNVEVKKNNDELTYFEMHLAIKTAKDGIIILSPQARPGPNDLVFEFAVGIDFGVITVLRLRKEGLIGRDEVARVRTDKLISPTEYTQFYIIINDDVLTFGKKGEEPIIAYSDVRLKTVKYFDMSSYGKYSAKFLYDCPSM